jgi:formamidopyrimidine-DNA glycosylase
MPEVVEVRGYTDFIKKKVNNEKLEHIKILNGRYKKHGAFSGFKKLEDKLPLKLIDVDSKGKFMYIRFEDDTFIGVTLGLSGGWFFEKNHSNNLEHGIYFDVLDGQESDKYLNQAKKHLNVEFKFESGILYFPQPLKCLKQQF